MKTLIILLALLITTIYAGEVREKKSVDKLFESFEQKQITNKSAIELENENISLKIEIRSFRIEYYALRNEVRKLKSEAVNHHEGEQQSLNRYTKEQVRGYISRAQNETWFEGIMYSTGERQFLATLSPEDYQWYSAVLLQKDISRIEEFMGDKDYKTKLGKIYEDYESYFHAKRKKNAEIAAQQEQPMQTN